jgi:hypothetical protein
MRLSLIPISLFASTVLASEASIIGALELIANATLALNNVVENFPPGPAGFADVTALITASGVLIFDIMTGTQIADASANLTLSEAIDISGETATLVSIVQSSISTIIAKKPIFDADLISPLILLNLKEQKAASDAFSAAVVSKVPSIAQGLAESIIAPIDVAFDEGIGNYTGAI